MPARFDDPVQLQGMEEALGNLRRFREGLGPRAVGNPILRSLRAGGRVFVREARRNIDSNFRGTGRLRRAVGTVRDRRPRKDGFQEQIFIRPRDGRSRDDERGAWYWRFLEFGRKAYQLDEPRVIPTPSGPVTITEIGAIEPRPYLTPAYESKRREALNTFAREIAKDITKLERKLAVR